MLLGMERLCPHTQAVLHKINSGKLFPSSARSPGRRSDLTTLAMGTVVQQPVMPSSAPPQPGTPPPPSRSPPTRHRHPTRGTPAPVRSRCPAPPPHADRRAPYAIHLTHTVSCPPRIILSHANPTDGSSCTGHPASPRRALPTRTPASSHLLNTWVCFGTMSCRCFFPPNTFFLLCHGSVSSQTNAAPW